MENKKKILKAYNTSLNFLSTRNRSAKEIKDNLYKKKYDDATIAKTLLKLARENLFDDKQFALEFVSTREKIRPKSKFALTYELRKKGISDLIIEHVLKGVDEYKSAMAAVKPKLPVWQKLEREKFKTKVFNFLKNRGFTWDISFEIYEKVNKENNTQEKGQ